MKKAPTEIDKQIGARIRARRTLIGMSQEKLAEGLGLTFQQVQKYEKGTNRISAGRLSSVAEILGVGVDHLWADAGSAGANRGFAERPEVAYEADPLSPEALKLARTFRDIRDPGTRKAIVALVQALARADEAE